MKLAVLFSIASLGCGATAASQRDSAVCSPTPLASARALLRDAGLSRLRFASTARDVRRQAAAGSTSLCFERAVMLAVSSLAMESRTATAPVAVAQSTPEHAACALHEAPQMVSCYMNRSGAAIGLAGAGRPPPVARGSGSAWWFWLEVPELSPMRFWAAVERSPPPGVRPRVIGFGVMDPKTNPAGPHVAARPEWDGERRFTGSSRTR